MKRILSLSVLSALLAACSTPSDVPPESGESGSLPGTRVPAADGPLVVPPLSALPDTPPRALAGKFKAGTWSEMPGWSSDDLTQFLSLIHI